MQNYSYLCIHLHTGSCVFYSHFRSKNQFLFQYLPPVLVIWVIFLHNCLLFIEVSKLNAPGSPRGPPAQDAPQDALRMYILKQHILGDVVTSSRTNGAKPCQESRGFMILIRFCFKINIHSMQIDVIHAQRLHQSAISLNTPLFKLR